MEFAEQIIQTLKARNIEPDYTFTAAAGADWGQINAWDIAGGQQAVESGNNATTDYSIVKSGQYGDFDGTDALEILSPDDKDPLTVGTILGIDAVDAAKPDDAGPFLVMGSRDFYGPTSEVCWETDEDGQRREFATYADAENWIAEQSGPAYLSHNQASGPVYKIVTE